MIKLSSLGEIVDTTGWTPDFVDRAIKHLGRARVAELITIAIQEAGRRIEAEIRTKRKA